MLEQVAIAERTGIAFIRIAHDVLARRAIAGGIGGILAGLQLEAHGEARTTAPTDRRRLDLVQHVRTASFQHLFPQRVKFLQRRHRRGEDRIGHRRADIMRVHPVLLLAAQDIVDAIDGLPAVVQATHVESRVLMATAQAAHVPDLLRLEVRLERMVYVVLRTRHQAGAAIAHVGLDAPVLLFQEVVERTRSVGDRFAHEEVVRDGGEGFVIRCAGGSGGILQTLPERIVQLLVITAGQGGNVLGHGFPK